MHRVRRPSSLPALALPLLLATFSFGPLGLLPVPRSSSVLVSAQPTCPESQPSNGDDCSGLEGEMCSYGSEVCCYPTSSSGCGCQRTVLFRCGSESQFWQISSDMCMWADMAGGKYCGSTCEGCDPPSPPAEAPTAQLTECPENQPSSGDDCSGLEGEMCKYGSTSCCYPTSSSGCSCTREAEFTCWDSDGSGISKFGRIVMDLCMGVPLQGGKYCGSSCEGCDPPPGGPGGLVTGAAEVECTCPTDGSTYTLSGAECTPTQDLIHCPPYLNGCPAEEPDDGSVCHGLEGQTCEYGNDSCCYETSGSASCVCGKVLAYSCGDDSGGGTGVPAFTRMFTEFCGTAPLQGGKYCGTTCDGCDPPATSCPKENESDNLQVAYNQPQECENCRKFKAGRTTTAESGCDGWKLVYVLGHRANVTAVSCPDSFTLSMTGPDQSAFSDAERAFFGRLASSVSGSDHASNPGSLDYLAVQVSGWLQAWPSDDFPVSFQYPCTGCGNWFDPNVMPEDSCAVPEAPTPPPVVAKMVGVPGVRRMFSEPMTSP